MKKAEYAELVGERDALVVEKVKLLKALEQCLTFIEHKCANEGKATTDEQWDANVARFRESVSRIGIGRSYTDKAAVDLAAVRALIANANR